MPCEKHTTYDGYCSQCKYLRDPEGYKRRTYAWREKNRARYNELRRANYHKNRKKVAKQERWRDRNPEWVRAYHAAYWKTYYAKNRDALLARRRTDEYRAIRRAYYRKRLAARKGGAS